MTVAEIIFVLSAITGLASVFVWVLRAALENSLASWLLWIGAVQWPIVTLITILLSTQGIV